MWLTVPYTGTSGAGGGGVGGVGFLFHERLLMTLVIYVLIDVKFNRKRQKKKMNILSSPQSTSAFKIQDDGC